MNKNVDFVKKKLKCFLDGLCFTSLTQHAQGSIMQYFLLVLKVHLHTSLSLDSTFSSVSFYTEYPSPQSPLSNVISV